MYVYYVRIDDSVEVVIIFIITELQKFAPKSCTKIPKIPVQFAPPTHSIFNP